MRMNYVPEETPNFIYHYRVAVNDALRADFFRTLEVVNITGISVQNQYACVN